MTAFVLGVLTIFHLFFGSAKLLDDNCGLIANLPRNKRLTGGEDAYIFSNPWMVLLLGDSIAGGSLINSHFVMTAAHALSASFKKVRLGEYDRESSKDCTSTGCLPRSYDIDIADEFIHPAYQYENYRNDIALLRMAEEVTFSDYIRPICLLVNEQVGKPIPLFKVTGWGKTNSYPTSRILKTAIIDVLDITNCTDLFETQNDGIQICAGSLNSDTCSGDSGGPLSATLPYNNTNRVFQFGIISYGTPTCDAPSLYTNVTHFMDWIVNTTSNKV
ncbi:spaetzle-processing enzyme [Drosophila biarmipes]|uniref:spaetzle-processing enzyme n=1 Tax=Drosophila biarmipes TaxID=125945 RepID=UPI0007E87671|nr:spaetzle-processing enzyme [Drosophila biarmipes]